MLVSDRGPINSYVEKILLKSVEIRYAETTTIQELLGEKSSGSSLEIREYGRRDPSRLPRDTICLQKLALTSPTRGVSTVDTVRSRTEATEFAIQRLRYEHFCNISGSQNSGYEDSDVM
jgi:hypothetical protein